MAAMTRDASDTFLSAATLDRLNLYRTIRQIRGMRMELSQSIGPTDQPGKIKDVPLQEVATFTGRNYGSIYHLYQDLTELLQTALETKSTSQSLLFGLPIDQVRALFVKVSIPLQYLEAVLNEDQTDLDSFCESVSATKVTINHHLQGLRTAADYFDLQLRLPTFSIVGSEQRARLFLSLMFWNASNGGYWPFSTTKHADAMKIVDQLLAASRWEPLSPIAKELFGYYVAVSLERTRHGHLLPTDAHFQTLKMPLSPIEKALKAYLPKLSDAQIGNEVTFWLWLLQLLPSSGLRGGLEAQKTHLAKFEQYAPDLYKLVNAFMEGFPAWDQVTFGKKVKFEACSIDLLGLSVGVLGMHSSQLEMMRAGRPATEQVQDPKLKAQITATLEAAINAEKLTKFAAPVKSLLADVYTSWLQEVHQQYHSNVKVTVKLLPDPTLRGTLALTGFLNAMSFVQVMPMDTPESDVDMVIQSTALASTKQDRRIFQWNPSMVGSRFGRLYTVLGTLWQEKMEKQG